MSGSSAESGQVHGRSAAERLYGGLLLAYPAAFRGRFGRGMRFAFVHQLGEARRRGRAAAGLFWLRTLLQVLLLGLGERLHLRRAAAGGRARGAYFSEGGPAGRPSRPRSLHLLRVAFHEARLAARRLLQHPGFALAAVLTLALGIGANAAIYSVVHAVLLSPLPYPSADRLVWLWHSAPGADITEIGTSYGAYHFYRENNHTLEEVAAYNLQSATLTDGETPARVLGVTVTASFFELFLGGPPALGRVIGPQDDVPGASPAVVISHRLWQQRYGADPDMVGRSIELNGAPYAVLGVLPITFDYPSTETDVWLPRRLDPARLRIGGFGSMAVGRLRVGVDAEEAQRDLSGLVPRLAEPYSGPSFDMIVTQGQLTAHVTPLIESTVGDVERMLWIMLGTVGFVLLTACANVANLFLARAEGRRREVAVRTALGAGRARVLIHFLSESVVLGVLGGGLGLGLAVVGVRALVQSGPAELPRLHEVGVSLPVVAFTAALALGSGLTFGMIPALRHRGTVLADALRDGGRSATPGHARHRARGLLVTAQVALALILMAGAGLMVRSFWAMRQVDPGFRAAGLVTFRLSLPGREYPDGAAATRLQREVLDSIAALPGVTAVGATTCVPLAGCGSVNPLYEEGVGVEDGVTPPAVEIRAVAAGTLETLGIPLLSGRLLERSDLEQLTGAAVVSRSLAERFWPGEDPVGRRVFPDLPIGNPWYTIVGVVGDAVTSSVTEAAKPTIYLSLLATDGAGGWAYSLSHVVRTSGEVPELAASIRAAVRALNPNLAVAAVTPVDELLSRAQAPAAFAMVLLVIAGGVALLLGAIGVYGVLSYMVSQRTGEIGVRMALGAGAQDVRQMVMRQGATVAALGLLIGLAGSLLLSRLLTAVLFSVSPSDPLTYLAVVTGLAVIALVASYLPARRASRVQPVEALRE